MTPMYARAQVGSRAIGRAPRNQGKNLTVVGAIALDGVRAMMAYEGGTTREAFFRFVREILVPSLNVGDVVVMDNLSSHHSDGVRQAIEAVGASVLYLPPYSPELNPIEMAWSKVKTYLRRIGARTIKLLAGAISSVHALLTPSDLAGWFQHAGYSNQSE